MPELISEPLFSGATLLVVARYILCALLAYNILWSFRGLCDLVEDSRFNVAVIRTAIFFTCAGLLLLEVVVLSGNNADLAGTVWALVWVGLLIAGQLLLVFYHISGLDKKIARFFYFYPNIGQALPIVELARVDPDTADKIHQLTMRLLVKKILDGPPGRLSDHEDVV